MKTVNAVYLSARDNCATLTDDADEGDVITFSLDGVDGSVTARGRVPRWHKTATAPIKRGEPVYKYGSAIGTAFEDIAPGDHVHIHNIR